jgi:glycogen synthase
MPAQTNSYTIEALKGQAVTKQLRDTVTEISNRIGNRLFEHAARFHGFVCVALELSMGAHA